MQTNKIILLILLLFMILSCHSIKTKKIVFYSNHSKQINVYDFKFKTHKGGLYFSINDKEIESLIVNKLIVDSIEFHTKDSIIDCKPYDILSSEITKSTFSFARQRNSNNIQYYLFENDYWFLIGLENQLKLVN